jgi:hypothetical protein
MLCLKHNGEQLLIREVDANYLKKRKGGDTAAYVNAVLSLVVNREWTVNSFIGCVKKLNSLIEAIERKIING